MSKHQFSDKTFAKKQSDANQQESDSKESPELHFDTPVIPKLRLNKGANKRKFFRAQSKGLASEIVKNQPSIIEDIIDDAVGRSSNGSKEDQPAFTVSLIAENDVSGSLQNTL